MLQNLAVYIIGTVTEHHSQFLTTEPTVAFMAAFIRAIYDIIVDVDRFLMIIRFRDRNINHYLPFDFNRSEIAIKEDIPADFLTIIQNIEEVGLDLIRV